jgi:hypothetical protein
MPPSVAKRFHAVNMQDYAFFAVLFGSNYFLEDSAFSCDNTLFHAEVAYFRLPPRQVASGLVICACGWEC